MARELTANEKEKAYTITSAFVAVYAMLVGAIRGIITRGMPGVADGMTYGLGVCVGHAMRRGVVPNNASILPDTTDVIATSLLVSTHAVGSLLGPVGNQYLADFGTGVSTGASLTPRVGQVVAMLCPSNNVQAVENNGRVREPQHQHQR